MKYQSIVSLFDEKAEQFGDEIAFAQAGRQITYRHMYERANNLANFLIANGASKGDMMAIATEDQFEAIVATIAVLKAGGIYVPLDPSFPEKRIDQMLSLVEPGWFLIEPRYLDLFSGAIPDRHGKPRVVCLGGDLPGDIPGNVTLVEGYGEYSDARKPVVESDPDDMCYVYFTSGSTGVPKGIAGRLKGIDHFINWEIKTLDLGPGVRVSQFLPLTFDGSLRDIFIPLCAGGTICVPENRETLLDARKLIGFIEDEKINVIHCVSSLFHSIVNEGPGADQFGSLRHVLITGEPLLPVDVGRWTDTFGDRIQLINLYGNSETTLAKFCYFVKPADKDRQFIPIGQPIEGAKALIIDEKGRPCPAGAIGEIYIRTQYRSHGYYNQPELTKEVFVQNPFSDNPDDIVYKTGDMGRLLDDGNYEYLGRRDQQVKIRGMRIELGDIENCMQRHEGVGEAVVIDRQDSSDYKYLCAYIVPKKEVPGGLETGALRDYLAENLPEYMIPSAFIMMESIPRTISGKLDRRALPKPGEMRTGNEQGYVAPQTPTEEAVAAIWSELLGIERISIHDNFFEIGGHSLLGTQLLSRVRSNLNVDLPLHALFESPTVLGLALAITQYQVDQENEEEMAQFIKELKEMSDSDLDTLLGNETHQPEGEKRI